MRPILAPILFLLIAMFCAAEKQSFTIRGQVICRLKYADRTQVELLEHDTFDPDDLLGGELTGSDGKFELRGAENEWGSIRLYVRITHQCNVFDVLQCKRVTEIDIPMDEVQNGLYEMNRVDLTVPGHRDTEKCE